MFIKLGNDLEPLRRYAADLVRPFEQPGDPLADWYPSAKRRVPQVRLVFSNEEAAAAEALLARHLESNVLGDDFTENSFTIERVHHLALLDLALVSRRLDPLAATGTTTAVARRPASTAARSPTAPPSVRDRLGPQGSGLSSGAGSCSVGSGEALSAGASSDLAAAARLSRRACFASRFACARAFRFCSF